MAHSIKPNTEYDVVTLSIAIEHSNEYDVADALNETLRPHSIEGDIADYSLHSLRDISKYKTGDVVEEGEMFSGNDDSGVWMLIYDNDSDQLLTKLFTSEEIADEFAWTIALKISGDEFSDVEQLKKQFDNSASDAIGELSGWMHYLSIDYLTIQETAGEYDANLH